MFVGVFLSCVAFDAVVISELAVKTSEVCLVPVLVVSAVLDAVDISKIGFEFKIVFWAFSFEAFARVKVHEVAVFAF